MRAGVAYSRTYDTGLERLKEERGFLLSEKSLGRRSRGRNSVSRLEYDEKSENSNPSEHMVSPRNNKKESRLGSDQIFKKSVVLSHHILPIRIKGERPNGACPNFPYVL